MIIKVCGMRETDNIRLAEQLTIDWMGFIFYPKSPRYVKDKPSYLPQKVKRVGVFVNAQHDFITSRITEYKLELLQLHGDETPQTCEALRKETGKKIIKAFGINENTDFGHIQSYESSVDYFLFDSRCESLGGSGQVFNHQLLEQYQGNTPFLLSGGLSIEHLAGIKSFQHPQFLGVDLNSRFEISPGVKSIEKLEYFIKELRSSDNE